MSYEFYKFKVLMIGMFFGFYSIFGLQASSLSEYPQIYKHWNNGNLSLAISQLEVIANKRANNDNISELLKKVVFQKRKLDQWISQANDLEKQKKYKEAKRILRFVKEINPNYTLYRELIYKIKTTEEELKYPSTVIFNGQSLDDNWKPYERGRDGFSNYTQFKNNRFIVDLPGGKDQKKVGIASVKSVIDLTKSDDSVSYGLKFNFEPAETNNFVINLKDANSYRSVKVIYRQKEKKSMSGVLELWKNGRLSGKLDTTGSALEYFEVVVDPNSCIHLTLPDGRYLQTTPLDEKLSKKRYKLEIYSHTGKAGVSAQMAIKKIGLRKIPFLNPYMKKDPDANGIILFDGKHLSSAWKSYERGRDGFANYTQFKNNRFIVDLPGGKDQKKVGIASVKSVIDLTKSDDSVSYGLKFNFEPAETNDFVINLKDANSYRSVKVIYRQKDKKSMSGVLELWSCGRLNGKLKLQDKIPESLVLVIQPNNFIYLTLPDGNYLQTTSLTCSKPKKGYKVEIYSQVEKNGLPSKMGLKNIILDKSLYQKSNLSSFIQAGKNIVLFDGEYLDRKWVPYGRSEDFLKYTVFKKNQFIVNMSGEKRKRETGILSVDHLVWLDDFTQGAEVNVTFNFDPKQTNGFAIALAKSSTTNRLNFPSIVFRWNKMVNNNKSVMKLFLNNKEVWKEILDSSLAPKYVTFKLEPENITLLGDGIPTKSTKYKELKSCSGFKIAAYACVDKENLKVKMALQSIKIKRKSGTMVSRIETNNTLVLPVRKLYSGEDKQQWETVGVAGGSFEKFGHFKDGKMVVTVPGKNSWGKTGILSKEKFIHFNNRLKYIPYSVKIEVDPSGTTGFVVVCSHRRTADMWHSHKLWISLIQLENGSYSFKLYGPGNRFWERIVDPAMMDGWNGIMEILFENKSTTVRLKKGICITAPVGYKPFSSAYATILSHPDKKQGSSKLILKNITGQWVEPEGMRKVDRWQYVDDADFDPDKFLQDFKEEIQ